MKPLSYVDEAAAKMDFYVAPDGNDKDAGTVDKPFATLERARDAVRELKKTFTDRDITVLIRGGKYLLSETVTFGPEDSGNDRQKITYAAYPGEEPVFSSGVTLTEWKKLGHSPEGLPENARGNVWAADAPKELGRFLTLYENGKRLSRAKGNAFAPTNNYNISPNPAVHNGLTRETKYTLSTLHFPEGAIKNWSNISDVEILIIPIPWTMNILPLATVDEEKKIAKTAIPGSYALDKTRDWIETVWVENAIDYLDSPGNWVLNTKEGTVYLWPVGEEPGDAITAPCLKELIRVEGDIDFEGPTDTPVRNLVFRGLTFTQGERDLWDKDHQGKGVQHDWEMYDRATSLVRFRGAENCAIEECRFTQSGGTALRLDLYCQNNRIEKNLIEHMGCMGILLCGYGPGTKDVNKGNQIVNNHIRHTGELYWHGHAMMVWQSGENYIAHNLIHHCPRKAFSISGVREPAFHKDQTDFTECSKTIRWKEVEDVSIEDDWKRNMPFLHSRNNIVEYNEVYCVLQKLGDGAALNVSGAGEGNVLRRNYAHHIFNNDTSSILRTDGWQCGTTFEENVIYKASQGGITRKDFNHVLNNFLVDVSEKESMRFAYFPGETPNHGSLLQRNILYQTKAPAMFYKERANAPDGLSKPSDCKADYNVFYCDEDPEMSEDHLKKLREMGIEEHSVSADPLFEDIENEDFRLKPDSPALKLGIKQIDISKAGLTFDFPEKYRPEPMTDYDKVPHEWRPGQTGARAQDNL